jgi:ferredoxin--NADP+ reductase
MGKVAAVDKLNDYYTTFEVETDLASQAAPGQIVLATADAAPPMPCPITGVATEKQSMTILAAWGGGDATEDLQLELSGPFGGHMPDKASRIVCVAEGIGVGAMVSRLEAYKAREAYTIVVAAYHSAAHMYWRDLLDGLSDELYIVTEDGSFGIKGPTRDTVKAICDNVPDIERIVAIGSIRMLKACARIAENTELPLTVGLAAIADPANTAEPDAPADHSATEGTATADALREFDWSRTELDGHKTDFDELARKLGLQTAR